jgi:hypothetical protein
MDNGKTLSQQAGIPVVELAVGKCGLAFESKSLTNHESGGGGFLPECAGSENKE